MLFCVCSVTHTYALRANGLKCLIASTHPHNTAPARVERRAHRGLRQQSPHAPRRRAAAPARRLARGAQAACVALHSSGNFPAGLCDVDAGGGALGECEGGATGTHTGRKHIDTACAHKQAHARTHTLTHTRTRTRTHASTHARTHTSTRGSHVLGRLPALHLRIIHVACVAPRHHSHHTGAC